MLDIEGKETIVEGCVACDAHTVSAGPIDDIGGVNTHIDKTVFGSNVTIGGRCRFIYVVHITSSRVGTLRRRVSPVNWDTCGGERGD